MDFSSFVDGPLLWIAFLIFIVGIITRIAFFFHGIIRTARRKNFRNGYALATFGRFFLPLHEILRGKPLYTGLRYVFHICMIVVPVWLGGHIILWEESRFGWTWTALPDDWADGMTLLFLGLAAVFLARRITFADIRLSSSKSDYFLIIVTALPFVTGYLLTHGILDSISFLASNIRIIHILSGEGMLVVVVFLFLKTQLNDEKCIGCAACELSCPTETLESHDEGNLRTFTYSHFQCVSCGACVDACPDEAAELRHEIGIRDLFQLVSKDKIGSVKLQMCKRCGALFAPVPQLDKLGQILTDDYIRICPRCKKTNLTETLYRLSPWYQRLGE